MRATARTTAVVALAALGLAGCGGGDGDPSAFAAATNRACHELTDGVADLRKGLLRTDARSEAAGLATAITRYATVVRRSADGLAAVRPPAADRSFQSAAVKGLRRHADAMRDAASQARRGQSGSALDGEVRGGELPEVPATVLADAPACHRTAD
ncbi:hypothetical protein AB0L40_21010 [Patulibacter sp. NPDC049589]|uniref:hypothetical protein n=1 Tax=Patulibacter sp. NPDC049589 TaxID=3154731 RepID=UPI00341E280F